MIQPPLVDAHAHIWSATMPVSSSAWFRPEEAFTAEQYLQVLDAQRSYYSAQQTLLTTRLAESNNLISLYRVLGGGAQTE